eukprot:1489649-Rhodomonas_salina.4
MASFNASSASATAVNAAHTLLVVAFSSTGHLPVTVGNTRTWLGLGLAPEAEGGEGSIWKGMGWGEGGERNCGEKAEALRTVTGQQLSLGSDAR